MFVMVIMMMSGSLFASGVGITGVGARATALGGNFRGVADDWSAMFWNPAGITQVSGLHAGASFELIKPTSTYTFTQNQPAFSVYRTGDLKNEPKTFPIPAIGVVYGMEKMSFGLSVFAPFGLGAKWDAMNTASYNSLYPEFDFEDDLQVIDIHPSLALKVTDKLSVGLGVSVLMSDILIRKPTTTPNPLLFDPANTALKLGVLTPLGLATETYNYLLTETKLEGDGMGFGFNAGLKYDLTECLSLGVAANWYNDISLDGKIGATTYFAQISQAAFATLKGTLDAMVAGNLMTAAQEQQVLGVYSGTTSIVIPEGTEGDAKLPLPMTIGGGIAYKGIQNLLVTADVSWTQWSSWDIIEIKLKDGSVNELVEEWKDGLRAGLGLEYKIMDPLKLRFGYYTEPSAIPDNTLTITIPDVNRRHAINLGASFDLGIVNLFASYEKIVIGERDVNDWTPTTDLTGFDNMAGKYKMNVDNFMFGVGLNF